MHVKKETESKQCIVYPPPSTEEIQKDPLLQLFCLFSFVSFQAFLCQQKSQHNNKLLHEFHIIISLVNTHTF